MRPCLPYQDGSLICFHVMRQMEIRGSRALNLRPHIPGLASKFYPSLPKRPEVAAKSVRPLSQNLQAPATLRKEIGSTVQGFFIHTENTVHMNVYLPMRCIYLSIYLSICQAWTANTVLCSESLQASEESAEGIEGQKVLIRSPPNLFNIYPRPYPAALIWCT